MNGFTDKGLDESDFGLDRGKSPINAVKAFDAFPKVKTNYTERTSSGSTWTVTLICLSLWLSWSELGRWWKGNTTHTFSVEQGVGRDLQINLDMVVPMKCEDLHVNVQDASGDRILAGMALGKDPTLWRDWGRDRRKMHSLGASKEERMVNERVEGREYWEEDVHDYLSATKKSKKFSKTPRLGRGTQADACRIFGTMHTNKVQGDFHITARGHGYMEYGQHLDHHAFNFSHIVNELSFGPFYPSLTNPLDNTYTTTEKNFYKFQYYLSVVPTIYTTEPKAVRKIDKYSESPSSGSDAIEQHRLQYARNTVFTNQYAVTEQSHPVPENMVPGVFVKYDIEPIQLTIAEEWASLPSLFIKLVNVVAGVLVAGGWAFQLTEWFRDQRRSRRTGNTDGILSPAGGGYGLDDAKRMS